MPLAVQLYTLIKILEEIITLHYRIHNLCNLLVATKLIKELFRVALPVTCLIYSA